jgi:hypothetical protein
MEKGYSGLTDDPEASVRITAMMALGNTGQTKRALELLIKDAKTASTDAPCTVRPWNLKNNEFKN